MLSKVNNRVAGDAILLHRRGAHDAAATRATVPTGASASEDSELLATDSGNYLGRGRAWSTDSALLGQARTELARVGVGP